MGEDQGSINLMSRNVIFLEEYKPKKIAASDFPMELAQELISRYSAQISLNYSPFEKEWTLTPHGYIGFIPISQNTGLHLQPKVGLSNLFRMLEIAYRIPIQIEPGSFNITSLTDFYERLANILARRILDRGRKGYYRAYESYSDILPYLREQVDVSAMIRSPWRPSLVCHYHENTADIPDNQILAWTMEIILQSGLCSDPISSTVRQAYRDLSNHTSSIPFSFQACINRKYNRLNEDYCTLHGLCRFFLEHTGPGYQVGDRLMIPFLIDMDRLFETFVAAWLEDQLPSGWVLKPQESVIISTNHNLRYRIDLVLAEAATGKVRCVLDTKYKKPDVPVETDINQVVAYAESTHCDEAILIYPSKITKPIDLFVGTKHVRGLVFDLSGDLAQAGSNFRDQLLGGI